MVVKSCKALYVGSIPARASIPSTLAGRTAGREFQPMDRRRPLPAGGRRGRLWQAAPEHSSSGPKQLQALRGPDITRAL